MTETTPKASAAADAVSAYEAVMAKRGSRFPTTALGDRMLWNAAWDEATKAAEIRTQELETKVASQRHRLESFAARIEKLDAETATLKAERTQLLQALHAVHAWWLGLPRDQQVTNHEEAHAAIAKVRVALGLTVAGLTDTEASA